MSIFRITEVNDNRRALENDSSLRVTELSTLVGDTPTLGKVGRGEGVKILFNKTKYGKQSRGTVKTSLSGRKKGSTPPGSKTYVKVR